MFKKQSTRYLVGLVLGIVLVIIGFTLLSASWNVNEQFPINLVVSLIPFYLGWFLIAVGVVIFLIFVVGWFTKKNKGTILSQKENIHF